MVQLPAEEPTPWYEHEVVLVLGATVALTLSLFTHLVTERLAHVMAPVFLRPPLYVGAFLLAVLSMRGAGNTLRTAGSVAASNGRLAVAGLAGLAVMFSSALGLFSLFSLLDRLLG